MLTPGEDHSQVSCMVAINLIEREGEMSRIAKYILPLIFFEEIIYAHMHTHTHMCTHTHTHTRTHIHTHTHTHTHARTHAHTHTHTHTHARTHTHTHTHTHRTGNEELLMALLTPLNVNCHAADGRKVSKRSTIASAASISLSTHPPSSFLSTVHSTAPSSRLQPGEGGGVDAEARG